MIFEDINDRRAEILRLMSETPLSSSDIAIRFNVAPVIVNNDIALLSRVKLLRPCGHHPINTRMRVWETIELKTAEELRNLLYKRVDEHIPLPDLPDDILLMMGYSIHGKPRVGRKIDNSNFHPTPVRTAPVKVHIGNAWSQLLEMAA